MKLIEHFQSQGIDSGVKSENVSGTIVVTNKGDLPLKVVSVAMKLIYDKNTFPPQVMTIDGQERVLAPNKTTQFQMFVDVPLGGTGAKYKRSAQIHCSDLAGVSEHTFSISDSDNGVINQSVGFQPILTESGTERAKTQKAGA